MLSFSDTHSNIINIHYMIIIFLLLLILILGITIICYRKSIKRYQNIIVRLMNEKRQLLKEIPPDKRANHILSRKVSEEELISLMTMLKHLIM